MVRPQSSLCRAIILYAVLRLTSAQCGEGGFRITGSPAVKPIAISWAREYAAQCQLKVIVDPIDADSLSTKATIVITEDSDTVSGAAICNNSKVSTKVDVFMSTSPIIEATGTSGLYNCNGNKNSTVSSFIQVDVALDSIAVIVKQSGVASDCINILGSGLTQDQLRWIFSSDTATNLQTAGWSNASLAKGIGPLDERRWSRLHSKCSKDWITIGIPSPNSEYFNFFQQALMKNISQTANVTSSSSRPTFTFKTDNEIVSFIEKDGSSIGYIGFPNLVKVQSETKVVSVEDEKGFYVTPNATSITSNMYIPLSRTLYMILSTETLSNTRDFFEFGYSNFGKQITQSTGLIIIPSDKQMNMFVRIGSILPKCLPKEVSCTSDKRNDDDDVVVDPNCIALNSISCGCSDNNITIFVSKYTKRHFKIWKIYYELSCVGKYVTLERVSSDPPWFRACKFPAASNFLDIAAGGMRFNSNTLFPSPAPRPPRECSQKTNSFVSYNPNKRYLKEYVVAPFPAPQPPRYMYTNSATSVHSRVKCFLGFALSTVGSVAITCNSPLFP